MASQVFECYGWPEMGQKVLTNSRYMELDIVMLKNEITMLH